MQPWASVVREAIKSWPATGRLCVIIGVIIAGMVIVSLSR